MPAPLTTPTECRVYADECERLAAFTGMLTERQTLLSIAAQWRKIADDIEAEARR